MQPVSKSASQQASQQGREQGSQRGTSKQPNSEQVNKPAASQQASPPAISSGAQVSQSRTNRFLNKYMFHSAKQVVCIKIQSAEQPYLIHPGSQSCSLLRKPCNSFAAACIASAGKVHHGLDGLSVMSDMLSCRTTICVPRVRAKVPSSACSGQSSSLPLRDSTWGASTGKSTYTWNPYVN